jgi:hypothetical protein
LTAWPICTHISPITVGPRASGLASASRVLAAAKPSTGCKCYSATTSESTWTTNSSTARSVVQVLRCHGPCVHKIGHGLAGLARTWPTSVCARCTHRRKPIARATNDFVSRARTRARSSAAPSAGIATMGSACRVARQPALPALFDAWCMLSYVGCCA